ncbi:MAG: 6-phosphofructokinase [Clostridia bacterium]|nr:6-phosphofructokinase [Clostridia bacterium]
MNVIVGQSGGPTSVINASLAGVYQAALKAGAKVVYGMKNGIKGLLEGRLISLNGILDSDLKIELLKRTPSSFLGSCRYKLKEIENGTEEYEKIFTLLKQYDIGCFFYIGGNDSMDTIGKLSAYGKKIGSSVRFVGVPKTIDNDLMVTDHTPGYGSAAKFVATVMKEIICDATVYGTNYVTIVEVMGRNAGWLTAASALAKGEDCVGVDMICLPEIPFTVEGFIEKVANIQKRKKSVVIAVSEGVKLPDGRYVCELSDTVQDVDSFGHKKLTGTAQFLANECAKKLKTKTRAIELSTLQRCCGHLTSRTDITEAYQVGGAAVLAAMEGKSGVAITLVRISDKPYQYTTGTVEIEKIANLEKKIPVAWINDTHTDMLAPFFDYARPLIQAELTPFYVDGLPYHISLKE